MITEKRRNPHLGFLSKRKGNWEKLLDQSTQDPLAQQLDTNIEELSLRAKESESLSKTHFPIQEGRYQASQSIVVPGQGGSSSQWKEAKWGEITS
jgi:hypothetical protein